MLSVRDGTLHYISAAFLSEDIETTIQCLLQLGIEVKNSNNEFKPFNEVMEQIYNLHIREEGNS
jgi:5-enolpyruvylshikimate-3-phosphate synthase